MVAMYGGRLKGWHVMDNSPDGYIEIGEIQAALRGLEIEESDFWPKVAN